MFTIHSMRISSLRCLSYHNYGCMVYYAGAKTSATSSGTANKHHQITSARSASECKLETRLGVSTFQPIVPVKSLRITAVLAVAVSMTA